MMEATFIRCLAASESEALGFIPWPRVEKYVERGQVIVGRKNDDPAGFIIHGRGDGEVLRIYQAAICADARRDGRGAEMVSTVKRRATAAGKTAVWLRCAADLADARQFWEACGFYAVGTTPGGRRGHRKYRDLVIYRFDVGGLFTTPTASGHASACSDSAGKPGGVLSTPTKTGKMMNRENPQSLPPLTSSAALSAAGLGVVDHQP